MEARIAQLESEMRILIEALRDQAAENRKSAETTKSDYFRGMEIGNAIGYEVAVDRMVEILK